MKKVAMSKEGHAMSRPSPYRHALSGPFLVASVVFVSALAFVFGKVCRYQLVLESSGVTNHAETLVEHIKLPQVTYMVNESLPTTVYSAQNFDTSFPATSSSVLASKDYSAICESKDNFQSGEEDYHYHYSYGQHILIDIENVDSAFLNHAGRLSQAMIDVSRDGRLQLLSVHCHALIPMGVTCVGVMLKSHITFHTWPEEGVILLDLMTFQREEQIDDIVKSLEHYFGVPSADPQRKKLPHSKWALKRRGFQDDVAPEQTVFERYVLGSLDFDYKKQVAVQETPHFKMEVFDSIGYPRRLKDYERSLDPANNSYESMNSHLYKPDRILLFDQIVQTRRHGMVEYNEALVHPAMLMHPHPRKVVILGGGTGSALREVLKHRNVESVVVVELEESLVDFSRVHLPEWSDCSNIVGSSTSCFDDTRSTVVHANGLDWLTDNRSESDGYDVVIIDVDPLSLFKYSTKLNEASELFSAISNSMSHSGIFVIDLGHFNFFASGTRSQAAYNAQTLRQLELSAEAAGFMTSTGGLLQSFNLLMGWKGVTLSDVLSFNEATADASLLQRLLPAATQEPKLKFIDGATFFSFSGSVDASARTQRAVCTCESADGSVPIPCDCQSATEFVEQMNQAMHDLTRQQWSTQTLLPTKDRVTKGVEKIARTFDNRSESAEESADLLDSQTIHPEHSHLSSA